MKLSDLKVDAAKAEQGAWVGNIPEMGDLRLKVRGFGNADYRRLQAKLSDAEPRANKPGGRLTPEAQDRIGAVLLHETILVDWSGLEGDDGAPQPYDRDFAKALLSDPNYARFRAAVAYAAGAVTEDGEADLKDAVGN